MPDTNFEKLQAAGQARYRLDLNGALRRATGLNVDAASISRLIFGDEQFGHDVGYADNLFAGALLLDGTANSYAETTDKLALDIPGDIDIRAEYFATSGLLTSQNLVVKWTPAAQQSYRLALLPFFNLVQMLTSSTGANTVSNQLAYTPVTPMLARRATLDVDNGAAGRTARFYEAPTLDGPWVEMAGSPVITAGVTTLFVSTAVLRLGTLGDGTEGFIGRIHRAEVRNGIDGAVVANPDFRSLAVGTTSFADAAGNTWNLGSAARVV